MATLSSHKAGGRVVGRLLKPSRHPRGVTAGTGRARWLLTYVAALDVVSVALIAAALPSFTRHEWLTLILFVSVIVLGDFWTVPLSGPCAISLSFTPSYAAAVLFGPGFGALAMGLGILISDGVLRRRGPLRVAVNAGQGALVGWATGFAYASLHSHPSLSLTSSAVAFGAAAVVYVAANCLLASGFIALHGHLPWRALIQDMKEGGVFYLAMAPLGALLANAYSQGPWTLLYFPLLLWVLHKGSALYVHLKSDTDKALVLLADTLDKRDPYTYEHSKRVADHSERIAIALGLPTDMVELVVSAAHVHDLGKISIDNRILFKEGKLTEDERRQINKHPAAGAALAGQFNLFGAGADIILHHHERWDGTGYPEGLAGEDIPLGARIIAVADVYDAMTSDRPYRAALSHDVAIAELEHGAGTQFDARCVEAFLSLDRGRSRVIRPTGTGAYARA